MMTLNLYVVALTCVKVVVAVAHSESAGWPSGSSADGLQIWGKVWGFPLSPHCLLGLPLLSHSCHCASFDRGSQFLWPCRDLMFLPSPPVGPGLWKHILCTHISIHIYIPYYVTHRLSAVVLRHNMHFMVCAWFWILNKYSQYEYEHVQQCA